MFIDKAQNEPILHQSMIFLFIFVHNFIDNNLQTQPINIVSKICQFLRKELPTQMQACFDEYNQDLRYDINQINRS